MNDDEIRYLLHAIASGLFAAWALWRLAKVYWWRREIVREAMAAMERKHPGEFSDREDLVSDYYASEGRLWYWISASIACGMFVYFLRAHP